jgi:hypothetical protein
MTAYRHIITIALLLAILFLPHWVYIPAILAAAIFLPFYWEAILFGFVIDTLYGTRGSFPAALVAGLAVALLLPIRERLRLMS